MSDRERNHTGSGYVKDEETVSMKLSRLERDVARLRSDLEKLLVAVLLLQNKSK